MKKNALNLIVILLSVMAIMSSCKKDKYPPSLSLDLEPYIIYYQDTKYEMYDADGIKINHGEDLEKTLRSYGSIQSYIDLKHESKLKYSVDDNGEFWSAEYLNSVYEYPSYNATSLGEEEPVVKVTFDPEIGIQRADGGIDLGLATSFDNPYYTFTYTATSDGETTTKKVHLRVYNSYSKLAGLYVSRLSLVNTANVGSLWVDKQTIDGKEAFGYGYGDEKVVKFTVDAAIDLKMKVNRLVANNKLKGTLKGVNDTLPTNCTIGAKKGDKTVVELPVTGSVIEDDPYINSLPLNLQDDARTLIVLSNRFDGSTTRGRIKQITVKDGDGKDIEVPLICIEFSVKRYKLKADQTSSTYDYEYNGEIWDDLDTPFKTWSNTFRETFVKQVYWTAANKEVINLESEHFEPSN